MTTAQTGIFALGTRSHHHLELALRPGADPVALVQAVLELREPKATTGGANLVVGFGAQLWRTVAPQHTPAWLRPFAAVEGIDEMVAPATQRDVWVWIHGSGYDVVFDAARAVAAALEPLATLELEQPAFVYRDSRDLTGFIDGTENPSIDEAPDLVLVPEGQPGTGGSIALVQRWVHDLGAFHALSENEQERVIGRTKVASTELDDGARPQNAHISRVVIEDDQGEEIEVFRRSTPFGTLAEHGLVFIAFAPDVAIFDRMLRRMYGLDDGVRDRLTDFSRAVSGSYFFVPAVGAMRTAVTAR